MKLSFCAKTVRESDRDRFYTSLFVPAHAREGLLALYALNVELSRIHSIVSEEMIGQVRLAWWQQAIDGLYAGSKRAGQPVLEVLMSVIDDGHMPQAELTLLVEAYRAHFPEMPPEIAQVMEKISLVYIELASPESEASWRKAHAVIERHRAKYGKGWNPWLNLKILAI